MFNNECWLVSTPLTEKTWGRGAVVLVVNLKNGGHFSRFKSKNYSWNKAKKQLKTWQEQQEDNSKGDICYLENICGAGQT